MTQLLFTCSAENITQERLEEWAVTFLRNHGWIVDKSYLDWEKPAELAKRLGISSAHLSRSLHLAICPKPFDVILGKGGQGKRRKRIVYLKTTPELEAFLIKHKHGILERSSKP